MISLDAQAMRTLQEGLTSAQADFAARFPGESSARQPVHVVYGGAHLFKAQSAQKLGALARQALSTWAPDALSLAEALDLNLELAARVFPRVVAKLEREPVEDLRIEVKLFVGVLAQLERKLAFPERSLRVEFMVEAAQGIIDAKGRALLPQLHAAADGRLHAAHLGTYDYTASLEIAAVHQAMRHPACELAKAQMKWAFAGTGVFLSDGATTRLPIAPHKGTTLTDLQREENRRVVHASWLASAADIRHSLSGGFYQGWDLHPAQLVARYGTVFAFFLESLRPATERLSNFVKKLGQATISGDVFDDAATGQGLLNFFLRGLACGALSDEEVAATGLTPRELQSRSFSEIARQRRARG